MTPIVVLGQSLRVNSVLGVDLSTAESVAIKYKAPGAEAVSLPATVDDPATGAIHADIPAASLTPDGEWSIWGVAVLLSGDTVKTYGSRIRVVAEGTVVA
jgi:hypothetical protein